MEAIEAIKDPFVARLAGESVLVILLVVANIVQFIQAVKSQRILLSLVEKNTEAFIELREAVNAIRR